MSDDVTILEAARKVCETFGLGNPPPLVSWKAILNPGARNAKSVTPHFPVVQGTNIGLTLIISPVLQGRLAPGDWVPFLAPPLILHKRLRRRYNIGAFFRVLPGLLLLPGFLIFVSLYDPQPGLSLVLGYLFAQMAVLVLGVFSGLKLGQRLVLEADREAADVLGSSSLIEVFQKLESMRQLDQQSGKIWGEVGDHPSIVKRIANLQHQA